MNEPLYKFKSFSWYAMNKAICCATNQNLYTRLQRVKEPLPSRSLVVELLHFSLEEGLQWETMSLIEIVR